MVSGRLSPKDQDVYTREIMLLFRNIKNHCNLKDDLAHWGSLWTDIGNRLSTLLNYFTEEGEWVDRNPQDKFYCAKCGQNGEWIPKEISGMPERDKGEERG